ncbi:MAG: hypothetical protein MR748_01855 [Clostridiales bacterium]|nr:hypothetical protein [Clostridiales bacterium]
MESMKGEEGGRVEKEAITLEEIIAFYKEFGIETNNAADCPAVPSAFEDIPLQFGNSTTN